MITLVSFKGWFHLLRFAKSVKCKASTSRICNFEWYFIIILFYRKFHCISCNFPKSSSNITSRLDNIIIYNKTTTGWHLIYHTYIKLYNILKINKTKIYLETIFYKTRYSIVNLFLISISINHSILLNAF